MNDIKLRRGHYAESVSMLLVLLVVVLFRGCAAQIPTPCNNPNHGPDNPCFLNKKRLILNQDASKVETIQYYKKIDPADERTTLEDWKTKNHFLASPEEVSTVYYNSGDLNLGREMHCLQFDQDIACYGTNYGPDPANQETITTWFRLTKPDQALNDAINGIHPFATVAMEYYPQSDPNDLNMVRFYLFGADGKRAELAQLDSEGPKSVPQMCLVCHGGTYDQTTNSVTTASFCHLSCDSSDTVKWMDSHAQIKKTNSVC